MSVEVVREPVGKTVLKNSGTNQNVLVLFQHFLIKWKSSAFVNTSKRFRFVSKFSDYIETSRFRFKRLWNT
jgi:hypothetical protein